MDYSLLSAWASLLRTLGFPAGREFLVPRRWRLRAHSREPWFLQEGLLPASLLVRRSPKVGGCPGRAVRPLGECPAWFSQSPILVVNVQEGQFHVPAAAVPASVASRAAYPEAPCACGTNFGIGVDSNVLMGKSMRLRGQLVQDQGQGFHSRQFHVTAEAAVKAAVLRVGRRAIPCDCGASSRGFSSLKAAVGNSM